jgi:hypothetical protein
MTLSMPSAAQSERQLQPIGVRLRPGWYAPDEPRPTVLSLLSVDRGTNDYRARHSLLPVDSPCA